MLYLENNWTLDGQKLHTELMTINLPNQLLNEVCIWLIVE